VTRKHRTEPQWHFNKSGLFQSIGLIECPSFLCLLMPQ
jgi:hypothetical protein